MNPNDLNNDEIIKPGDSILPLVVYSSIVAIIYYIYCLISHDFFKQTLIILDYLLTAAAAFYILRKDLKKIIKSHSEFKKLHALKTGTTDTKTLKLPNDIYDYFSIPLLCLLVGVVALIAILIFFNTPVGLKSDHMEGAAIKFLASLIIAFGSVWIFSHLTTGIHLKIFQDNQVDFLLPMRGQDISRERGSDDPSRW